MQIRDLAGLDHLPGQVVTHDLTQSARRREQPIEIDARVVAHALQHVHDVFSADVPGCARRKRTPAEPTQTSLETHHARRETGEHVRQSHAARVVEVQG